MSGSKRAVYLKWMMIVFVLSASTTAHAQPPARAGVAFSESLQVLGRIEVNETLYPISMKVSADNAHIAYAGKSAKGMFAAFDGQRGSHGIAVAKGTPLIAPGHKHWAYIAHHEQNKAQAVIDLTPEPLFDGIDAFVFSPDGSRWAYRAGKDGKQAVAIKGAAQATFDLIDIRTGPLFSPDGSRLAYGALNGKEGFLVVDGKALKVDGAVEQIVFSPDAKRLAFIILKKATGQQVALDGQPGPFFQKVSALTFSPDSRRFAYMAQKGSTWVAVVDGQETIGGDSLGTPLFSADSRRLAYAAHTGKEWFMIVDGKKSRRFDQLGISMFSPDSSRLAYMAQIKERACMVVDDQMGPIYDSVGEPVFSSDSKQLAYRARQGSKWCVVQNGKAHAAVYDGLRRPVFSPDGGHLAYVAIQGKEMIMVLDQRPLSRHDSVTFPFFSPGGAHLAYAGCTQDQWRVYVDGTAGQTIFDATLKDGTIFFDGENQCRMIALKMPGPEFLRLDIQIAGNPAP